MTAMELINRALLVAGRDTTRRTIRLIGLAFMGFAVVSIAATFVVLTGLTTIEPTPRIIQLSVIINALLILGLMCCIGWEVNNLIVARRRGKAAAKFHVRIVAMFSFIAAIPAVMVAMVASITLDQGLDRWFETRVRTIVDNAVNVAGAYVNEHIEVLASELRSMADEIDRNRQTYINEPSRFDNVFREEAAKRNVTEAFLIKEDGTVVVLTNHNSDQRFPRPTPQLIEKAESGEPIMIRPGELNMVGGIMKLFEFDKMYLYVLRVMDPRVISYQRIAQTSEQEFTNLEERRTGVQVAFALLYIGVSLVLILCSIWLGFGFSNRLVTPIRRLIAAANKVSGGDLQVQVPVNKLFGDLENLGTTFNKMTSELNSQREALLTASEQIDQRRRFTEAVLAGVTAGVIGIDKNGMITLLNRSALTLLNTSNKSVIKRPIGEVIPELSTFIEQALSTNLEDIWQTQITLIRKKRERIVNVRLTIEETDKMEKRFVVTMDDITDLVTAQRHTAWSDVARRIAHEIKNPLTPIQLSAERIQRRYSERVSDDKVTFDKCVDTIVRQVGDIRRMVDEFSAFARMPKATFSERDLAEVVKQSIFAQSIGNSDIVYELDLPDEPALAWFDHRLVGQAVTNVVKNASEAVMAAKTKREMDGLINVSLKKQDDSYVLDVIDNGIGLPATNRERLMEPYMTTRQKGTGLGLSIVRKIMEEHGGTIELLDTPNAANGGQGALVRLVFKIRSPEQTDSSETSDEMEETVDDKQTDR